MVRAAHGVLTAFVLALILAACGGSPTTPTPKPPPPPPGTPTITSVTVSDARPEIGDIVQVTAKVTAGKATDQLEYRWSAPSGTFQGTGATVTWLAPTPDETPADITITLEVVEKNATAEATATKTVDVRVHDSEDELGDMAMKFLKNFANSSVSAEVCVQDFYDGCDGKQAEYDQIVANRVEYTILSSSLALEEVDIHSDRSHADIEVACSFTSRIEQCKPGETCVIGSLEKVGGTCALTGVYRQDRWWLCDSHFRGVLLPSVAALNSSSR